MLRTFGLPKEARPTHARFLAARGFDSVVVGVDETPDSIQPALDASLNVWSCRAAFSIRHLPDQDAAPLLAQDVDHNPRIWFGSGCPNAPALREAHLHHIRTVGGSGAFAGFMLDGIRFASPNAGDAFFTCFCPRCEAKASTLGCDFEAMHRDVRALRDWCRSTDAAPLALDPDALLAPILTRWPGVAEWLRFREACVREHVEEVRAAVSEANLRCAHFQLGAYLFAPTLAPWVGQDYPALAPLLDVVSPMLYRTLGPGDACLATEWAALSTLNLIPPHAEFAPRDVGRQVRLARESLPTGTCLVPILQLADDLVADVTAAARLASPDGLDYFIYRPGHERYVELAAGAALSAPAAPAP